MMARRSIAVFLAILLAGAGAAALLQGCGSAPAGEYESEVAGLLEEAARTREEIAHLLAGEDTAAGHESPEASAALEEAAAATGELIAALERVKVPKGREDEHRALLESLASELALYEGLLSALEPAGEQVGEEAAGHGEGAEGETHGEGEDAAREEGVPQGEEAGPGHGEEPAEGGH